MHKKLIARTAKLSSESKRSRRHQGIAIAYEHIPNDIDERGHGSIYALINVSAPSESAEEVTEFIIDAFHGEYYQDLNKDPLASFEAALARVNEELADITHHGNIGWLGNLNAILAVLVDDVLHISQAGKADAFLYRTGKASNISRDLAGDSINPLRTFINIASGELILGDKVVLATPGVFFHVSKDELQKYVEEFQPKVAVSHLADLLEGNSNEMQPNSIMIIEAISPEAASEETIAEVNDELWLTEPARPVETVIEKSAPFAQKALFYARKYWQILVAFMVGVVWPKITELAVAAKDGVTTLISNQRSPRSVAPKAEKVRPIADEIQVATAEDSNENLEDLTINEHSNQFVGKDTGKVIHIKESENKPKWLKLEKIDLTYANKLREGVSKKLGGKTTKNKRNILIAAVVLLLVLSIGIFAAWRIRENAENQKLADASYTEAQSKLAIGKTDIASGDLTGASSTLSSALSIANGLKSNTSMKDKATGLANDIQNTLDSAQGVVRVSSKLLGDASSIVGSNSIGPIVVGKNIFVIGKDNGSIAEINIASGEVSNVIDKPNLAGGKFTVATAVTARSVIVLFSDKGSIYEFDTVADTLTKQSVSGDVETPSAIASFSTNVYSIDSASGLIYRRTKVTGGYSARAAYIKDGTNVKGAIGIAIDSNVYALMSNGNLTQYLGGTKQEYNPSYSFTISKANSIFTNENTSGVYITEGASNRVIYVDANGKFTHQFVSDNFKNAGGANEIDSTKILYVLAGGKVYKTSL